MKKGYGVADKYSQDPIGSDAPRGKNRERRKHKLDGPTLTPTEAHIKNGLMRQFMRNSEGSSNSEAYKGASCWCSGCAGRRLAIDRGLCLECADSRRIQTAIRLLGEDAVQGDTFDCSTSPHGDDAPRCSTP